MKTIKAFILTCIISASMFAMAEKGFNYNYEMTVQQGTESIRPIAFYDNGDSTFIQVHPNNEHVIIDGNKYKSPPNIMVFYLDKKGSEVPASGAWDMDKNILSFPFVAKEWRIRGGAGKVIGIRKSR